jgi:PAS domain S-box-containing protein
MISPSDSGSRFTCNNLSDCLSQRDNYEAIFNSLNEGVAIVNADQVITMCNKPFFRITGLRRQDTINKKAVDVFCRHKTCGINQAIIKTFKTGRPCRDEPMQIMRRDKTKLPALISTSVLRNKAGDKTGIVVVFRDLSVERELQKRLHERYQFHRIIGKNEQMQDMYELIEDVADTDAYVLISGESGTGKELVAHALHYQSRRSDGPFIKVSCAALSEPLLESELFGHVKGSFTGAHQDKPGRFERAHKGTIFLDEIGEVGPGVQVKLLRVLQEKEIERVGDTRTRKVDVRVIAATNKNLRQLVREGSFREDLYYRLKVVTVDLPPLRSRKEDIPLLVDHFIKNFNSRYGKNICGISQEALNMIMCYSWEGNVRELEHAIEHAFVKARSDILVPKNFPYEVRQFFYAHEPAAPAKKAGEAAYEEVVRALKDAGWNQSKAARALGLNRTTVWRMMKRYNIQAPHQVK